MSVERAWSDVELGALRRMLDAQMGVSDIARILARPIYTVKDKLYCAAPDTASLKQLLAQTARDHDLTPADVVAWTRRAPIVRARQDFMWRARQVRRLSGAPRFSLPLIAKFLGGMDHTTVIHGLRAHQRRMAEEEGT